MEVSLLPRGSFTPRARARASAPELPPTARFARTARSQSQAEEKRNLGACGASQEREGEMQRGGQAPRPANNIKHGKMAVVGLAGGFWPISNTPPILPPGADWHRPRPPVAVPPGRGGPLKSATSQMSWRVWRYICRIAWKGQGQHGGQVAPVHHQGTNVSSSPRQAPAEARARSQRTRRRYPVSNWGRAYLDAKSAPHCLISL
jgi:hypothetical protein